MRRHRTTLAWALVGVLATSASGQVAATNVAPTPAPAPAPASGPSRPLPFAGRDAADRGKPMLTAREIMRDIAPYQPEIKACYFAAAKGLRAPTGRMQLELIIEPTGAVLKLTATAPGIKGSKLERCLRAHAEAWRFADAPGHTTAMIPYLFLKTVAPGAGPTGP